MTSYSEFQHDARHRENPQTNHDGDPRAMSVDSGFNGSQSKPPQTSEHLPQKGPDQPYSKLSLNVEAGAWKGVVSIPRAVSQDQSEEMSVSCVGSSSAQSYSRSSSEIMSSPSATIYENGVSPFPAASVSKQQQNHRHLNMSALTNRSAASASEEPSMLSFAGMERYFDADADGTAYFSVGGGATILQDDRSQDSQRTPRYLLESSVAISLSPSPVRSVGDIYQNTSLTPAIIDEYQSNSEQDEEQLEEVAATCNEEDHDTVAVQQDLDSSCQSNNSQQTSLRPISTGQDCTSCRGSSHRNSEQVSWASTIHHVTESLSASTNREASSFPDSVSRIPTHSQMSSQDETSWARGHSCSSQHKSSTSHSISSLQESRPSISNQISQVAKEASSWNRTAILSPRGNDELNDLVDKEGEDCNERIDPAISERQESSSQEAEESSLENKPRPHLNSFETNPLYQLQQLTTQGKRQAQGAIPLLSPLPGSAQKPQDDASFNISLGHYLSSCSTSARTSCDENVPEPRERQDRTQLSEIDVSAWTQDEFLSKENGLQKLLLENAETVEDDEASHVSGLSLKASESSMDGGTPHKKPGLHLDPRDFASPTTTIRQNTLDVELEESTGFVARIEELEGELEAKDRAMGEMKRHFEEQLLQFHEYTLPLQPHSPFDANNNKYSPDTQQQKLIERNQTLLKEVRFADQACVELSGWNTTLEEKLCMQEKELEDLRQQHQNLTKRFLDSNGTDSETTELLEQLKQAQNHKLGLDRQLYSAYDKLEEANKEIQTMKDDHAEELRKVRHSFEKDEYDRIEQLKQQIKSYSVKCDEQQQELEIVTHERDNLRNQVQKLAAGLDEKTSNYSKMEAELESKSNILELLRKKSSDAIAKLEETEQHLQLLNDLKRHETTEKERMQNEVDYWRKQAENLKKSRDESKTSSNQGATAFENGDNLKVPDDIVECTENAKNEYRRMDKEFTTKMEHDFKQLHLSLAALDTQFAALGEAGDKAVSFEGAEEKQDVRGDALSANINPAVLFHYLTSSQGSSGNEILSPQIIQVLQLFVSFTQQHLDFLDKKVTKITMEYAARLTKLYGFVHHIRGSLVFETESDDEGVVPMQETASRQSAATASNYDPMLDATFAAVTSIPDTNVERMEEARSPEQPAPTNIEIPLDHSSPARDTILDLSKIDAVNSPFYSSEITFSPGSIEGGKWLNSSTRNTKIKNACQRSSALQSVQDNILFQGQFEAGRKEIERLRRGLTTFERDFALQRQCISSFVASQHKAVQKLTIECSDIAATGARLAQEKLLLKSDLTKAEQALRDCDSKIEMYRHDLERPNRSGRLRPEEESSSHCIADLEQVVVDNMDCIGKDKATISKQESRLSIPQEKLTPTDDQEALPEAVQEPDRFGTQLHKTMESKEKYIFEIERLRNALGEANEAHIKLQLSFVAVNDKLASAHESAQHTKGLSAELEASKQNEARILEELDDMKRQINEKGTLVEQLMKEKKDAQKYFNDVEREAAALNEKHSVALKSYDEISQENASLQAKLNLTQHDLDRIKNELENELSSKEEALKVARNETEELRAKLADEKKLKDEANSAMKQFEKIQRETEGSLEQLKMSFAASQNHLAEAQERISDSDDLMSMKNDLEVRLKESEQEVKRLDALMLERDEIHIALQESREESAALRSEVAQLSKQKEDCLAEIDLLQMAIQQSDAALENVKLSYIDCQDKLSNMEDTEKQVRQELTVVQEQNASKAERIANLEKQAAESSESLEQLSQLRESMQSLKTEMGRDLKAAYERAEILSESLETLKLSYAFVNNKLAEALDNNSKNDATIEELQTASEAAEQLLSHTEEQLMDCRNELEEIRSENKDLAQDLEKAEDELCEATEEYIEYKQLMETKFSEKTEFAEATQEQLQDAQDKLSNFAMEISCLRREIEDTMHPSHSDGDDIPAETAVEMQRLKNLIPKFCESLSALVDKGEWSDERIQHLNEEVAKLRSNLNDEKVLSDELAAQLRETHSKVAFSTSKAHKLTDSLENEQLLRYDDKRRYFWSERARVEAQEAYENVDVEKLLESESQFMELSSRFAQMSTELSQYKERAQKTAEDLQEKQKEVVKLHSQKEIWENRCFKLRDYMRKLTDKCSEWETSYSFLLERCKKLQSKQTKIKQHMTGAASRELMNEVSTFRSAHEQLEEELNKIAAELGNICWTD